MLAASNPDRIDIAFDDDRLVADAGLLLPATLAQHLGLQELADNCVDLGDAPGRANAGDKLLTLVASALGRPTTPLRCAPAACSTVKAPSTLGVFLRSFSWGHVRQLASAASCSPAAGRPGRDRAVHRPRFDDLRDLRPGEGGRPATATRACAAITRCSPRR